LIEYPTTKEYQLVIDRLTRSSNRLKELITSLLELQSKTINYQEVNVNNLIASIDTILKNEYQIPYTISVIGSLKLTSDYFLLERIIYNLVENAIKYTINNPEIKIILNENKIIIADNGMGIASEHINLITQPFYCIDPSRSKKTGGYGLGLSIVKEYCSRLNYLIEVKSIINHGTTITITFN
ncbi:MAG: sensor histidine kinase, partial [Bacilli bacterium]